MITFLELKTAVRANIFPTGEAPNLVASHDKMFIDALVDLQTVVECLQQDNTDTYPQCSTFWDCEMTVLPGPRGNIKSVSVVDQIDPTLHQESTTAPTDYCARIYYRELDQCHFKAWKNRGGCRGQGCIALPLFFGLPCDLWGSGSFRFPPTDVGVPAGLPPLPLGFHYPQTPTDRVSPDGTHRWRARAGVWAKERGNIWIAPWIQSTETVIVEWDGIKRTWADGDPVDDDPLLSQAIEEYVRWRHADKYDHDAEEAARAGGAYSLAKQALIHQCREETRARECESSHARSSATSLQGATLFYNLEQIGTAQCPDGSNPVSVTIQAGSVNSTISVADANQRALAQATAQAQAQLNCQTPGQNTFQNAAQTVTLACTGEASAPPPEGTPVTVTVPAGTFTSTISQADADNQAIAQAQLQASAQLKCTFWNAPQTVTLTCNTNQTITATNTVAAHTFSSTVSQADADAQALAAATSAATTTLNGICPTAGVFWNTAQSNRLIFPCLGHLIVINWIVPAHFVAGPSQSQANATALQFGNNSALALAQSKCAKSDYTPGNITL